MGGGLFAAVHDATTAAVFAISCLASLIICFGLGRSRFVGGIERHLSAVQATHTVPTLRLGGIGIMLGYLALLALIPAEGAAGVTVGLSLVPVFLIGLLEDLHVPMSPRRRLLAVFVSCAIEIVLRGAWMPRFDIAGLDALMVFPVVGIPFTLLLVGGISHAYNLIDGLHGFSSGVAMMASCALGAMAVQAGDGDLARVCVLFAFVIAGFWVVNFPFGKLFLGDAGAYTVGYILAWLGISLLTRNPQVSAWAVFLVFAWPISETLWAMLRRKMGGRDATAPDRMHMHHVMLRGIEIYVFGRKRRAVSNPVATALLLPLVSVSMIAGVLLAQDRMGSAVVSAIVVLLFIATHVLAVRFIAQRRMARRLATVAVAGR